MGLSKDFTVRFFAHGLVRNGLSEGFTLSDPKCRSHDQYYKAS